MIEETAKISQATSRRLPLYYRFLQKFASAGKKRISSSELSEVMQIDAATIRRDFSYFGALGRKGYGYEVDYLVDFFRTALNQDEETDVALIGVEAGSENTAFLSDIAKVSPIIIISMVVFAPLLEEFIFRRVLFGGIYQKTNFIVAALISAVIFAAVHGELQHLLIYMMPALVFSYIYYRTKRLLAPIIAHLLMNGFVVIVQLNYEKLEQFQKMNEAFFTLFH